MFFFKAKNYVGIELGHSSIKVVGLKKEQKRLLPQFYRIENLDERDDDDQRLIAQEILRTVASDERVSGARLSVTLPASLAITRVMELNPLMPEEELEATIKDEISQVTFDDVDEMRIVVSGLDVQTGPEDKTRVVAFAINSEILEDRLSLLRGAGLKPDSIDIDSVALYNAFKLLLDEEQLQVPECLVEVGADESRCLILAEGHAPFYRVIDVGSSQITRRLMADSGISYQEAEQRKVAFFSEMRKGDDVVKQNVDLIEAFCAFAGELIYEVRRCIRHFQSTEAVAQFGAVYLTGGGARSHLLRHLFEHELSITTRFWDPFVLLASGDIHGAPQGLETAETMRLGPALGTVLQNMENG